MVNCSERTIIVRGADLSQHLSLIFVGKMCVFVSRPTDMVTFHRKTVTTQMGCWFSMVKRYIPKRNHRNRRGFRRTKLQQQWQTLELVEDFAGEAKNLRNLQGFRILHLTCFPFFGASNPALYRSELVNCFCHGDDFVIAALFLPWRRFCDCGIVSAMETIL